MHSEHHVYVDRAGLSVGSRRRLLAGLASLGTLFPASLAMGKDRDKRGFWKEDDWQEIPARPAAGPDPFLEVSGHDTVIVAELSTGHVIFAANPILGYPHITIWSGKWSRDGIDRNAAPKELLDTGLDVNGKQTIAGFQVLRVADSSSNKWIRITLV